MARGVLSLLLHLPGGLIPGLGLCALPPLICRNPPSWPRVRRGGRVDDSAHLLAAVAARRARLDALHDLQGVYQPAGRIKRGDGGCAPHGGAAVAVAPIISRGPAGGDSLDDAARLVGMNLDWSIISAWK